jgi:hypothetical protein
VCECWSCLLLLLLSILFPNSRLKATSTSFMSNYFIASIFLGDEE